MEIPDSVVEPYTCKYRPWLLCCSCGNDDSRWYGLAIIHFTWVAILWLEFVTFWLNWNQQYAGLINQPWHWYHLTELPSVKDILYKGGVSSWGWCVESRKNEQADPTSAKSTYNGHVSIIIRTWSNRRRWFGLMSHIFCYITWTAACVCVINTGNSWHQDAL